jgi:Carboxypeptidase regulatory-like domain
MPRAALDSTRKVFVGGLVLFLFVGYTQAQIDRASLTGTLIDASGAVIPDVKIEAVALDTQLHFETLTNKQGVYRLTALPVGNYVVTTTRQGFESIEIKDIKLQVGETRTLNLQLKVGAVLEKIEVPATTTPLQQTSSELGGVIEREQIANLPANGRNWASMLLLAPGAIDDGRGLVRAPDVWQIDFTLAKQTKITEWLSLEFRADAFNIFNHKQLGDPAKITLDFINADANGNPTFGSLSTPGDFGMINTTVNFNNNNDNFGPGNTGTGLPRQIQFSLRLKF